MQWLRAFLAGEKAGIIRCYTLGAFSNKGPEILITWDASHLAWEVHSKYKAPLWTREFFAARITEDDEIHLGAKLESHEGRQTWEALCGLVCLRPWRANWQSSRAHCMHRSKASQLPGNLPWTLDVPNTVQQWWNICLVLQTPSATCFHVGISLECYSSFPSS